MVVEPFGKSKISLQTCMRDLNPRPLIYDLSYASPFCIHLTTRWFALSFFLLLFYFSFPFTVCEDWRWFLRRCVLFCSCISEHNFFSIPCCILFSDFIEWIFDSVFIFSLFAFFFFFFQCHSHSFWWYAHHNRSYENFIYLAVLVSGKYFFIYYSY